MRDYHLVASLYDVNGKLAAIRDTGPLPTSKWIRGQQYLAHSKSASELTLPAGTSPSNIKVTVVYNGPIKAPIAQGQHIADLIVSTSDTPPQTMPLVAEKAVSTAGFFGRIWTGLTSLL